MTDKIKVLTVDDSGLMQKLLKSAISQSPHLEVIGQAMDSVEARNLIKKLNPDIITLDVEMPGMNGLDFLERLMNVRPMPVIMFSSHTAEGTEVTLKALEIGAVDFLQKPNKGLDKSMEYLIAELLPKLITFGRTKPRTLRDTMVQLQKENQSNIHQSPAIVSTEKSFYDIIAIGASTGGVTAIREVLERLPNNLPPIVITQHMPTGGYIERFSERLNRDCKMTVKQVENYEELKYGHVYIAPATHHFKINNLNNVFKAELYDGATVSGHRPSVDVMFSSLAKTLGKSKAVAIMLTGMGRDGTDGMLELKQLGCPTIGQNKETCVVYGMPRSAYEAGAIDVEYSIDQIAPELINIIFNKKTITKRKVV
jgi:two-component system chemotaxis response regulator CheB